MTMHTQITIFTLLILSITTSEIVAQGLLQRKAGGSRRAPVAFKQVNSDSTNKRQDVEGTIWEYKVFDHTEKDPVKAVHMTGKIRVKQSSVFAVGAAKFHNQGDKAEAKVPNQAFQGDRQRPDLQSQLRGRLSQAMNRKEVEQSGGERIGDISKGGSNKYRYQFDEDDQYPLSGLVSVAPDPQKKNGVWSGNYEEFSAGKKLKRWRFETRKIEE